MNTRTQVLCAWCGPLAAVLLFSGLVFAGFIPPTSPLAAAGAVAAIYQQNPTDIRVGTILILFSAASLSPFVAVISVQLKRIEGSHAPLLSYAQMVLGTAAIVLLVMAALIWSATAFRPDRPEDITLAFNDLSWSFMVMPVIIAVLQHIAIGMAIYSDRQADPVYPHWLGSLNFLVAVLSIPGCLMTFFKSGVFAWDGVAAFWVPVIGGVTWVVLMAIHTSRAARRQASLRA